MVATTEERLPKRRMVVQGYGEKAVLNLEHNGMLDIAHHEGYAWPVSPDFARELAKAILELVGPTPREDKKFPCGKKGCKRGNPCEGCEV